MLESATLVTQVVLVAGLLALAALISRLSRRLRALGRELAAERHRGEQLERDLQALLGCSREVADRLRDQWQKQRSLHEQLRQLQNSVDQGSPIEQAELLMEKGLSLEQISSLCQLSQGEVDLLARWAKHRRAA